MGYIKSLAFLTDLISSLTSKDGKLNLTAEKFLAVLAIGLFWICIYLASEYHTVYNNATEAKWRIHYMELEVERLKAKCKSVETLGSSTSVDNTTPVKKSSYEHPSLPSNPEPAKREPPKAVIRERVEDILLRVNG